MRHRRSGRAPVRGGVAASVIACLLAAAGACGVPTDGEPRALTDGEIPFALDPAPPTTLTTVRVGESAPGRIFLVTGEPGEELLVAVDRQVAAPATVETLLRELVTGPTGSDTGTGLDTAVNPATTVISVSVESGIATVDLSDDFVVGSPRNQILALAQMVYTATEIPGIGGVLLTLEGQRVGMLTDVGQTTALPVGRAAYARYGPS